MIASDNGCLPEIVPGIGAVLPETGPVSSDETHTLLDTLPRPHAVRQLATRRWDYLTIAAKYLTVYQRAIDGDSWT